MARPRAKELTDRELEIMQIFWDLPKDDSELTVAEVRDRLAESQRDLAYTTVATLVRILMEKNFLDQTKSERPFCYRARRSFEDVSGSLLGDLLDRVFRGSRELLLKQLVDEQKLTARERQVLEDILRESNS